MSPPLITGLYAAITGLMLVVLSFRIIGRRRKLRISIGDGGDDELARRIRAHGNFIEYVPLALILMAIVELSTASAVVVHVFGIGMIGGRVAHAWSLARQSIPARVIGMILTFSVLIGGSFLAVIAFIRSVV
jgi:hypothetical protein